MSPLLRYADPPGAVRVCGDEELSHGDDESQALTRFGPGAAGGRTALGLGVFVGSVRPTTFTITKNPSVQSKDGLGLELVRQHGPADSIATSSSLASSDAETDAESIELSALRTLARAVRTRSCVNSTQQSHPRFDSVASASTVSSAFECECEYVLPAEEVGVGSADRTGLERDGMTGADNDNGASAGVLAHDSDSDRGCGRAVLDKSGAENQVYQEDETSDETTPPLTPMSPRQPRAPHRIYVPSASHHDKPPPSDEIAESDFISASLSLSTRKSPDDTHVLSDETDTLLPMRCDLAQNSLPLPATCSAARHAYDERTMTIFQFSYSRLETAFHLLGVSVTTFLVMFSVWLTLSNVEM